LPLDYLDKQGSIRQAIIDRTFIAKDPANKQDSTLYRWIIDYKSSQPKKNEILEDFLAKESVSYGLQLAQYATLFSEMETLPQRKILYFPSVPAHIELS